MSGAAGCFGALYQTHIVAPLTPNSCLGRVPSLGPFGADFDLFMGGKQRGIEGGARGER